MTWLVIGCCLSTCVNMASPTNTIKITTSATVRGLRYLMGVSQVSRNN